MLSDEEPLTIEQMFEEWQKCMSNKDYFVERYCSMKGSEITIHIPNWMKAFELIQPMKVEKNELMSNQQALNRITSEREFLKMSLVGSGELIRRDELLSWIKQEMDSLEDLGNRADTTNMAAPYDWQLEAFKRMLEYLNKT